MIIKVSGADYSAEGDNIGNVYTSGVINLNKYEGLNGITPKRAWVFPQQTDNAPYGEAYNSSTYIGGPGCYLFNNVANPTNLSYIHGLRWTSAIHNNVSNYLYDIRAIDNKMTSYGYVLPHNCQFVQMGFWINKTILDSVMGGTPKIFVIMVAKPGDKPTSTFPDVDLFTPGEYPISIVQRQVDMGYLTHKVVVTDITEEMTIGGQTWKYVNLKFYGTYSPGADLQMHLMFISNNVIGKYVDTNQLTEFVLQISGVTVTTSDKPLIPTYNYPWEEYSA